MDVFDLVATIRLNLGEFERGLDAAKAKVQSFTSGLSGVSKDVNSAFSGVADALKPAAQGFQAVESVGEKAGSAIRNGLKGFSAASLAVGGFGAAAVNAGMSFDASMSKVSAISGAAGKDFDALRAKALEMGAKTKFSASEAAEAMTYMGMAGWKAGDMIDGIGGVMHLAAASGEDLATTSDIVTDALTAFGLTAADSGRFADVLAAASTNANTNVGMMGDTFRYVAPIAGAMGYSAEDTAVAIGLMANSGIKATQAGTALRAIITRMAKPTKESAAAMDALGISVTDSSGQMKPLNEIIGDMRTGFSGLTESEKASYAAMLAGQEAMSGLLAIAEAAPSDVEKLTAAIYGCNGAAEEMSATMIDNLQGDLTLLGSAFESLQIAVSDALTPTLRAFAQFGQQAMSSLLEGFQGGGTEGFFDALTGVVTQAAAFLAEQAPQFAEVSMRLMQSMADGILNARDKITDSANQIFGMLVSGLDSWLGTHVSELVDFGRQIVQSLFQGFISAGEIISKYIGEFVPLIAEAFLQYHEALFTVGIEILGAIGRGIAENKEQIAHIASETIAHLVDSLRDNADGIIEGALALLDALASGILDNLPRIVEAGAEIVAKLIAGMSGNLPAVAVVVGAVTTEVLKVTKAAGDIGRAFGSLGSLIGRDGANIQGVVSSIGGAFTTMGALAGKAVAALTGGLQALWAAMLANPITAVVAVVGALVAAFVLLWNNCEGFRDFWLGLWDKCKESFEKFAGWCKDGVAALKEKFTEWRDSISEKFSDIGGWFREKWDAVKESAASAAETGKQKFGEFRQAIDEKFGKVAGWFGERFRAAWDAVSGAWSGVKSFFSGKWDDIKGAFSDVLGHFRGVGGNLLQGLWNGISDKIGWLKSKVSGVVDTIKGWFTGSKGFDVHSPSRWARRVFEYVMEGGAQGLKTGSRELVSAAKRAVGSVQDELAARPLSLGAEGGGVTTALEEARGVFLLFLADCRDSAENFLSGLRGSLSAFGEWVSGLLGGVSDGVSAVGTAFLSAWAEVSGTWGSAPEWFGEICENIRPAFETLTAAIAELFAAAAASIQETFAGLPEAFQAVCDLLQGIWTQASTFFTETFIAAADAVQEAWAAIQEFFQEVWDVVVSVFEIAPQWFGETFAAALEALQEAFGPVIGYFTVTWEAVIAVFGDAPERFAEVGGSIITGLHDGVESGKDMLLERMEEIKQALLEIISSLTGEANHVVTDAMNQLSESVSSVVGGMKSEVEGLIGKIGEALSKLENAQTQAKALAEKAEAAEKSAAEKAAQAQKGVRAAATAANKISSGWKPAAGKTPTQLLREEKASYGKSSRATPTQVNRQERAQAKTSPNGYVPAADLNRAQAVLTPTQINRLEKQLAKGVGFGGGGAGGSGAGRQAASSQTSGGKKGKEAPSKSGTTQVFNFYGVEGGLAAAKKFRQTQQQIALGYV